MFSKQLTFLLKSYDYWGYYTEFASTNKNRHSFFVIFSLHVIAALCFTIFIGQVVLKSIIHTHLASRINDWFQLFCLVVVYWTIIIESFLKRNVQKQFWKIFGEINERYYQHVSLRLNIYFAKCLEFHIIVTVIQIILSAYFVCYHGSFPYYLFSLFFLVKMPQHRIFYYLLYVELIKFELKIVEAEVKQMADMSRNMCYFLFGKLKISFKKFQRHRFKWIRDYYSSIYELNVKLNDVFAWSQFLTVLCCFFVLLTESNWAYAHIGDRSFIYKQGFSENSCFSVYFHLHFEKNFLSFQCMGCPFDSYHALSF